MNSLSDLNGYANDQLLIPNDFRPTQFIFTPVSGPSISSYENLPFISNPGFDILSIINSPDDMSFTVNVHGLAGTTVHWDNLASTVGADMVVTSNASSGVYSVSNIRTLNDWETIKAPTITMPVNPPTNWSYTSTLTYWGGNTKTWSTGVTVVQLDQLTTPSDYIYSDGVATITNVPQVFDLGLSGVNNNSLTLVLTPSDLVPIGSLSSSASLGGASFFDPSVKTLTIQGNLLQVNDHLNHISYTPTVGTESTWLANYTLTNPSSNFTSQVIQQVRNITALYWSSDSSFYYNRNMPSAVSNTPSLTYVPSNSSDVLQVRLSATDIFALGTGASLSTTSVLGGTSSYSSSDKQLTISGTKNQINDHLLNLTYTPALDYSGTFFLSYTLWLSGSPISTRLQQSVASSFDTIIANMSVTRDFVSNTVDQYIFATTTPYISEVVSGATYTAFFSSAAGQFGTTHGNLSSNFSISGTKTYLNSMFSSIMFVPNKDVSGSQTFTYTQQRNGVNQEVVTVLLNGTARSTPVDGTGVITITSSQTYSLTFEQKKYLSCDLLVVGGGGGGGAILGGGGGGGNVIVASNVSLSTIPWTIAIGAPGTGQTYNYPTVTTGNATSGGNTTITSGNVTLYSARGGNYALGGLNSPDGLGGASGSLYPGGVNAQAMSNTINTSTYTSVLIGGGSGGGGAGGPGSNCYVTSGSITSSSPCFGGNSGPGISSSITGSTVEYGRGGGGAGQYDISMASAYDNGTGSVHTANITGNVGGSPNGGNGTLHYFNGNVGINYGAGGGGQSGQYYGRKGTSPLYSIAFNGKGGDGAQGAVIIKLY